MILPKVLRAVVRDDRGSEMIEWVLICGLICVVAFASIAALGTKVLTRWTSVNSLVP
jgi:Flp pilus assembly pilin Flp